MLYNIKRLSDKSINFVVRSNFTATVMQQWRIAVTCKVGAR